MLDYATGGRPLESIVCYVTRNGRTVQRFLLLARHDLVGEMFAPLMMTFPSAKCGSSRTSAPALTDPSTPCLLIRRLITSFTTAIISGYTKGDLYSALCSAC